MGRFFMVSPMAANGTVAVLDGLGRTRRCHRCACGAGGSKVIEADYFNEYTYHAQLEPLAAVAAVDADGEDAEVWIGTQSQSLSLLAAVQTLETTHPHERDPHGRRLRRTFFARVQLRRAFDPVTRDQTSCQGHVDARG
jgi:hypothetical protein